MEIKEHAKQVTDKDVMFNTRDKWWINKLSFENLMEHSLIYQPETEYGTTVNLPQQGHQPTQTVLTISALPKEADKREIVPLEELQSCNNGQLWCCMLDLTIKVW